MVDALMNAMQRLWQSFILKSLVTALIALVLFGVMEMEAAWVAVGSWMVWRFWRLVVESMAPLLTDEDWRKIEEQGELNIEEQMVQAAAAAERRRGNADADAELEEEGAEFDLSQEKEWRLQQLREQIAYARKTYVAPRPTSILVAEAVGCVTCLIVAPLVIALATADFFSFRRSYGLVEIIVFLGCAAFYALPLLRRHQQAEKANPSSLAYWLWWGTPAVVLIPWGLILVKDKHPYLDPFNPQRGRLAAEKVLSLEDGIVAAAHSDWVMKYAEILAAQNKGGEAVELCEWVLRMDPNLTEGHRLMNRLKISIRTSEDATDIKNPHAPYVEDGIEIPRAARNSIDNIDGGNSYFSVLLVPIGEVSDELLDFVAFALQRETGIQFHVYAKPIPLPAHTRRRGILIGKQWHIDSLLRVLEAEVSGVRSRCPVKFVAITDADLYLGDANFVFAASYPWGALISTARFKEGASDALLKNRVTKQCYGSLIKSFEILPSTDPRCVTSYPASLEQFDAKGNYPLPAVRREFDAAVARDSVGTPVLRSSMDGRR